MLSIAKDGASRVSRPSPAHGTSRRPSDRASSRLSRLSRLSDIAASVKNRMDPISGRVWPSSPPFVSTRKVRVYILSSEHLLPRPETLFK
jgi:hypothetical protein